MLLFHVTSLKRQKFFDATYRSAYEYAQFLHSMKVNVSILAFTGNIRYFLHVRDSLRAIVRYFLC